MIPNPKIKLATIYEDKFLLVLDKQAGFPCYPLKENETDTVANALIAQYPELENVGPPLNAGIVHRLDNTTTGVLVVAKNQVAYDALRKIWNTPAVTKEYRALVTGVFPQSLDISYPIAHHPKDKKKMIVCASHEKTQELQARPADTLARRVRVDYETFGTPVTLVSVKITTGVRHQIRVHLAFAGHPLVGDFIYLKKQDKQLTHFKRPLLHLSQVSFPHPVTEELITLKSRGDPEFSVV